MANLIGSLRLVSSFDWSEFFESVSLVEQVLRRDPAGVYGRMDFRSRDRYRHAVEELAEPTGDGQLRVALKSVERARRVTESSPGSREAHVGYYLIGGGRRQFERSVDWSPGAFQHLRRQFFRFATAGYLGTIAAGHPAPGRRGRRLRPVVRLAWTRARVDCPARARADERADHPASSSASSAA